MIPTPNASDYQKVRLWSGIFSIGTNLSLIWAFYLASLLISPPKWSRFDESIALLVPVAAMLALGLFFDILTGFASETALGRTRQPFQLWLRDWVLVSLRVAPALYFGLLFLGWFRFQSSAIQVLFFVGAALFFLAVTLLLPTFLPRSWRLESEETSEFESQLRVELAKVEVPHLPIVWLESEDETTVNGAIPPLSKPQIWLASNVARGLSPRQAALLVRRDWWFQRTRKHFFNALICVMWLLVGLIAAQFLPAQNGLQAALGGAAWMTSWCFAALFVWPHLNRAWMNAADRDLLCVASRDEVETLLRRVQLLNLSDTTLSNAKVGVFHPIPDLTRRLENLGLENLK